MLVILIHRISKQILKANRALSESAPNAIRCNDLAEIKDSSPPFPPDWVI